MTTTCYTSYMVGTWTDEEGTIKVEIQWDSDGDADVRPYGNTDPHANWTVFAGNTEGLSW